MRGVCAERQELQQFRLPREQARQGPVGTDPDAESFVAIEACEGVEQVRLVIEKTVLQVNSEGQGTQHQSAGCGEIVNHLECVVLIENVFGRSVVGGQTELSPILGGEPYRN